MVLNSVVTNRDMIQIEKQVELLKLFQKNMIEFVDELIDQFEEEGDLILFRFFISEQMPIETLMERFIFYIHPHKDMIKERNDKFFLERDNIFGSSPQEKVIHVKKLYTQMSQDDKKTLWSWFDVFISISEKYKRLL